MTTHVTYIGGPTALVEYAGLRILLDPTFDEPHHYPEHDLDKTAGPGLPASAIEPVDLVLLSHHGHADNFDDSGRELAMRSPLVLSLPEAAAELGAPVVGLEPWQEHRLGDVTVTALPGRHGPRVLASRIGPVTAFLVTAPGEPSLYVSGDNSSLALVHQHASRFGPVDIAILFAGAARVSPVPVALTLTSKKAADAARMLGARRVVGVHVEDWAHFSESRADLEMAFADAGLDEVLVDTPRGARVAIEV
ncbi:MBL fold metallo-hydrolase [Protaetiibacter sp. SSC-01]|uniref:MBL fold metallo-hydrolase n=1 Tax=Protaetiibacter sp. SSC-01 TaxID=2759943 RepID=UPI001656ED14|nr:MBL fold metallo-hydrolase [Protaetiibacter sp. SSC-01]QNO38056.1 MBL fold metallo-hydrolase [Protaetiibacter sp. SSC-01]